jgi:hypothetical protein
MNTLNNFSQVEYIFKELDRLITELSRLRSQVAALNPPLSSVKRSVRRTEYFGMWAGREDMAGQSSQAWLEWLRSEQWRPV